MRRISLACLGTLAVANGMLAAGQADSQPLLRMAATERAFAAATAELGVRDGFLTFFAADAIAIHAGGQSAEVTVQPAHPALAAQPMPSLPLGARLLWEPHTGQVSSDASLGWLTGPYLFADAASQATLGQGAYFSVWKRQPDGTWRVWLDEGVEFPDVWQPSEDFRAAAAADVGRTGTAGESIASVEAAVASRRESWRDRLAAGVRLHRQGLMPLVGPEAVDRWRQAAWRSVRHRLVHAEVAGSDDLGVAIGAYDAATPAGSERGTWVRVWQREASGRWRIVFETSKAVR